MYRNALLCIIVLSSLLSVSSQPIPPKWKCPSLPPAPAATNVRQLRPQDIQAIMAVGDSMTAGFAMHAQHLGVLELIEYRGDVYSIGGNPDQYTIPNFLKNYNPKIQGASIGQSLPLDAEKWKDHIIQPFDSKITHLNAAQSQARIDAVPAQLTYLANELKTTYRDTVNFDKDWKMLTILIGANNICPACTNRSISQPDYFEAQMRAVITQVHQTIPRVFVNLLPLFNMSQVWNVSMKSLYCKGMWDEVTTSECGCLTDHSTQAQRHIMDLTAIEFNKRLYTIAADWQAKNISDFNVVIQPFLQNLVIPGLDFVSELDCFHPSADANLAMSVGLWNNMMSPPSKKSKEIPVVLPEFICPGPNDYIQ